MFLFEFIQVHIYMVKEPRMSPEKPWTYFHGGPDINTNHVKLVNIYKYLSTILPYKQVS